VATVNTELLVVWVVWLSIFCGADAVICAIDVVVTTLVTCVVVVTGGAEGESPSSNVYLA